MAEHEHDKIELMTERFERRLTEETHAIRLDTAAEFGRMKTDMAAEFGKVRTEMANMSGALRAEMANTSGALRTEMANGFGALRAEMIDRNNALLKWGLMFGVAQTTAIAGVVALLR